VSRSRWPPAVTRPPTTRGPTRAGAGGGGRPPRGAHASIARITLAESTGTSVTYQHVLLVDPYSTGSGYAFRPVGGAGNQSGADVLSGHAGGVTWYGNKLFLATGHQLQV
ncbi:hypothetical protein ABZ455_44910, partial [Streptomyces avermitilis]